MKDPVTLSDRIVSSLASLLFAVSTAFLLWFGLNRELALLDGGFLSSVWLWGTIVIFSVVSFVSPNLFISMLGSIWNVMYRLAKWN